MLFTFAAKASNVDSLLNLLPNAKDTQKVVINIALGKAFLKQLDYFQAIKYFNKAEEISSQINYLPGQGLAWQSIGKVYSRQSSYDTAEVYYKKALSVFKRINRPENKIELMNDYAILYYYKAEYHTAIKIFYSALSEIKNVKDIKLISRIYNNLGNCYYFLKDFKSALKCYSKAYNLEVKISNKNSMANCLGNIGLIYFELGEYESSIKNHLLSYNLQLEMKDTNEMAASLINMGMVYEKLNQNDRALFYSKESLRLRKLIKDERRMALSLIRVASLNAKMGKLDEAKNLYEEALEISKRNNSKQYLMEAYEGLSDVYEQQGNCKRSLEYHHLYAFLKDSIYSETSAQEIAEAQEKYESEKKQKALEILKKDQIINQIKLEKNKSYLYITVFIIIIVTLLLGLLFKQFSLKQKSNLLLEEQNNLITTQKKEITDSINYASIIQRAILPLAVEFNQLFPKNFIFYHPKDIVSGDFYWCGQKEKIKVVIAADCTGHGVPGAMMSMVGSNILSQAFNELNIIAPKEILHFLDNGISKSLHQNESIQLAKNSLDLSICVIDEENHIMLYGGSMNPIYLIRNKQLMVLKTDKLPIGYHLGDSKKEFITYSLKFEKGDRIYLFTDGISDQFGGEKGKKLMAKKFQQILIEIQDYGMNQQSELFNKFMNDWKGAYEQTDDILLIGIEL
jgi:serine phosphatase RsbU (regulator of sigma subunit)/Tfp pilus assembly protein PilF